MAKPAAAAAEQRPRKRQKKTVQEKRAKNVPFAIAHIQASFNKPS